VIHHPTVMRRCKLANRASAVTAALAELDVRPDDRVLIMLPDGPGFLETVLGVMQRGAVPLSVNPGLAAADVAAIAAETGARLVLASAKRIPQLAGLDAQPPVLVKGLRARRRLGVVALRLPRTGDGYPPARGRRVPVTPSAGTGHAARPAVRQPAGPAQDAR
jgi:acyl-CoA synthetase (AMP-forming)/AMP-acid ligase II